jgi:hypothetical protein
VRPPAMFDHPGDPLGHADEERSLYEEYARSGPIQHLPGEQPRKSGSHRRARIALP